MKVKVTIPLAKRKNGLSLGLGLLNLQDTMVTHLRKVLEQIIGVTRSPYESNYVFSWFNLDTCMYFEAGIVFLWWNLSVWKYALFLYSPRDSSLLTNH